MLLASDTGDGWSDLVIAPAAGDPARGAASLADGVPSTGLEICIDEPFKTFDRGRARPGR
jgi:hypothetical protein